MSLETYELDKLMQQYSISELRNIPEYVALCNAHAKGLSTIQGATNYLTNAIDINKAVGVWLDYLGWLEDTTRSYGDISKFFSVNKTQNVTFYAWENLSGDIVYTLKDTPEINDVVFTDTDGNVLGTIGLVTNNTITVLGVDYTKSPSNNTNVYSGDLNVEKYFWFAQQSLDPNSDINEEFFRRKILAKIQYNKTRCTRNDNINIIKGITFADHVIIENVEPMLLDITLYGDNIISTTTMFEDIESVLANGVGINNLQIKGLSEYEET